METPGCPSPKPLRAVGAQLACGQCRGCRQEVLCSLPNAAVSWGYLWGNPCALGAGSLKRAMQGPQAHCCCFRSGESVNASHLLHWQNHSSMLSSSGQQQEDFCTTSLYCEKRLLISSDFQEKPHVLLAPAQQRAFPFSSPFLFPPFPVVTVSHLGWHGWFAFLGYMQLKVIRTWTQTVVGRNQNHRETQIIPPPTQISPPSTNQRTNHQPTNKKSPSIQTPSLSLKSMIKTWYKHVNIDIYIFFFSRCSIVFFFLLSLSHYTANIANIEIFSVQLTTSVYNAMCGKTSQ